jgi:hypothetical protein
MEAPGYAGTGLVNLVAELETRLTGAAPSPPLERRLAATIPEAPSYVLVVCDGLGDRQLAHPDARPLLQYRVAAIDAPFPTTTTVSLATVATGLPPSRHGLLGYQLWLPDTGVVVNTIKWTTLWGEPVSYDTQAFLPGPNTWERLRAAGVEPITVQPASFEGSPLTRTLYRGCRFEAFRDDREAVAAACSLAEQPGRLILLYLPYIDFAAHVAGQNTAEYAEAVAETAAVWERLAITIRGAVAVGTADHGHVDVPRHRRVSIPKADHEDRIFYGDPRVVFVRGAPPEAHLPATWVPRPKMEEWWGPPPRHPAFEDRAPDGVLVADDGYSLLHRHADDRLIGQHGGLTSAEVYIPLLVAAP